MQTAVGKATELGGSPRLCRLETRATRKDVIALKQVLGEQFIVSQEVSSEEPILDVEASDADASDMPLHGGQELSQFHGHYGHYCHLPLYIYCGKALGACVLRNSRIVDAKHAAAVIRLLVKRLRQVWPEVRIKSPG
jgi:hypothetical protein